jgi:hypothetical protein
MKKKLALALCLAAVAVPANAKTCVLLDYDNSPTATVWGRITTTYHNAPRKGGDLRAAAGPFLTLDRPLLASTGADCFVWRQIAILGDDSSEILVNQHVKIEGTLGRFGSALVVPAVFIEIKTIRRGSPAMQ